MMKTGVHMHWTSKATGAALLVGSLAACGGAAVGVGETVTVAAAGASNPTVAVGADGAYYVAWVGTEDGVGTVWLARSADGRTFAEPVRVNDIEGDAAPHEQAPAQVAASPDGQVYVVWQNNTHAAGRRFPYSDLRFARSADGGRTFEPAITVNDDAGGPPASHTFHDIAVGDDGTVVVSWIDGRASAAAERAAAAAAPVPASVDAAPPAGETVAAPGHGMHGGHDGAALADPGPGPEIRIARSTDEGRTFGASMVVAVEACPCCRTSVDVDAAGEVAVTWRAVRDGSVRDIVVAHGDADGFGAATPVHADGWEIEGCPHAGAGLTVDASGRTHVAWYTGAPEREGLYYATAGADGVFGEPVPLQAGGWVPVSQVKLAAADGGVLLAWDDRRADQPTVQLGWLASNAAEPARIAEGLNGASPAVAANGTYGALAWLDGAAVRFAPVTR
jgi:hypothetical protein